jgi:copper chaperone CopZ
MTNKKFNILDMECPSCAMRLELLEDKLEGVLSISASFHKQQMEVAYDESRISEDQIVSEIERLGFHIARGPLIK